MRSLYRKAASTWSEISRVVLIANLLVTVVAVGGHAAVLKATGADDVVQFMQVLARTAPLALATAGIVFAILWQLERDDINVPLTMVLTAAALCAATWVANRFGDLRVTEPRYFALRSTWGLPAAFEYGLGMLAAYYSAYGARDFWSSVIVGGALGWLWNRVLARLRSPAEEADDEDTGSNRLAA